MTLEQQIALLNDNVGSLTLEARNLTDKVENKLAEYESWKNTIHTKNPVILQVGQSHKFKHPVEAALHIQDHQLSGDILFQIEIEAGLYEFPYKENHQLLFSNFKNVNIIGKGENPSDVIFRYIGDNHCYMILAEKNSSIEVKNISLQGNIPITTTFMKQIRTRALREGMAGGGLAHGIMASYNSYANVENCSFYRLWHALYCDNNSAMNINNVNGSELQGGAHARINSAININRSTFRGIVTGWQDASWAGLGAFHGSSIFSYGVTCLDFWVGLYSHWNSDFHFHRAFDYDNDGVTQINIRDGLIENCYHAIHVWHHSGGNVNNSLMRNMRSHAVFCGQSSNMHACNNVIVEDADIGFHAIHSSCIVANDSIAKNCRNAGYSSFHKSEIHASGTKSRLSGNRINYSPGGSHALGNHDSYIYFS